MNELMTHLAKNFEEELEGVTNYSILAGMADKAGRPGDAAVLRDVAREEFCHAKHLKAMIHEAHEGNPPENHAEMAKKWKEAEAVVHGF